MHTPSPDHAEFDQLTGHVGEFEHLPQHTPPVQEVRPDEPDTELDGMIMTGLISPV